MTDVSAASASEPGHGHGGTGDSEVDPDRWYTGEFWDERYSRDPAWPGEANPLLVHYAADLAPGAVLLAVRRR